MFVRSLHTGVSRQRVQVVRVHHPIPNTAYEQVTLSRRAVHMLRLLMLMLLSARKEAHTKQVQT